MRSLCDAGHDLVVGQTFRLKTLFVLVGLRAHGLTARDIVIGAEDPEEFHRIRIGLHEDYEPTSTIELELVDRVVGLVWRLRRIPVLESVLLDAMQEENASTANDFTCLIGAWETC
jgi:hypothetical protein